jgi:hypothetical protein
VLHGELAQRLIAGEHISAMKRAMRIFIGPGESR